MLKANNLFTVYSKNLAPVLFSPISPPEVRANLKPGLYIKDYIRKWDSGRIQDGVNKSEISIGRK